MKKNWIRQRLQSFKYAFQGILSLFQTEPNVKLHLLAAIGAIGLAFLLKISTVEWALIILCIFLVLAAEAFNTSLEALTNLVSPEHHPLAGRAKDLAAGAVLLAATGAAICGALIFLPKILGLLWGLWQ